MSRIAKRFEALRAANRAAFVPFITAGDPDMATCQAILNALPKAGADTIELGMPFSDPMAEGKPIQASSLRALKSGHTMEKTLELVRQFRMLDRETPIVLMGYTNPIHAQGYASFVKRAAQAGVDGLIVVDMPPEEDGELRGLARASGISLIRLATPTSTPTRLETIVYGAYGFIYTVSLTGVTGAKSIDAHAASQIVQRVKQHSKLPVAVGFGIKTADQATEIAKVADAVVVGSAIVQKLADFVHGDSRNQAQGVQAVLSLCKELSDAVHNARVHS
jgi:tryptophan synthase alpha chain